MTLAGLRRGIAAGRARLGDADAPDDQAAAARRLARVYGAAAEAVGGLDLGPADRTANRLLVQALEAGRAAFERVAAAASAGDPVRYGQGGAAVERAEQQVTGALARLEAAGYRVSRERP
jgi:hypothetical protein